MSELARVLRMSRLKGMVKIYLPTILPYFFSGARLVFSFGWRVALVAETLGRLQRSRIPVAPGGRPDQTDRVFARMITLNTMMAILVMGVLRPLENHLFRWKKEAETA